MRLYHASLFLEILKKYHELFRERINVLVSVGINEKERSWFLFDCRDMIDSIIADSGAWSSANGTSAHTVDDVISHYILWGSKYDLYFNFDDDFSTKGFLHNYRNQIKMEQLGLKPVPVIHNFFDDEIDFYVKSGKYDWLALGSSQSTNFDDLRYAVDRIKWGNPKIRIHWFGGSKYDWLIRLPIASCDTSSWGKTGAYGYINYWNPCDPEVDKSHRIYVGDRIKLTGEEKYEYATYPWREDLDQYLWDTFKYRSSDLYGTDQYFVMQVINTRFYVELERRINEERTRRGIALE